MLFLFPVCIPSILGCQSSPQASGLVRAPDSISWHHVHRSKEEECLACFLRTEDISLYVVQQTFLQLVTTWLRLSREGMAPLHWRIHRSLCPRTSLSWMAEVAETLLRGSMMLFSFLKVIFLPCVSFVSFLLLCLQIHCCSLVQCVVCLLDKLSTPKLSRLSHQCIFPLRHCSIHLYKFKLSLSYILHVST